MALYVIDPEKAAGGPGGASDRQTIERQLREVYLPTRPVEVEYSITDGSPAAEIIRIADVVGANLIVMGTHGRTGLLRLIAGSVAIEVLRRSNCPVMAMRTGEKQHLQEAGGVILHPTDFSKASGTALGVARSLARDLGARLVILHVAPSELSLEGPTAEQIDTSVDQAALNDLRGRFEGPDLKYPIETRLTRGDAAEHIVRVSREIGCDLIVMGTHGRTGLLGILLGNTAESVLPKAPCAVLVVKPPQAVLQPAAGRQAVAKSIIVF